MENYLNKARAEQILGLYGVKPKATREAPDKAKVNDAQVDVVLDASADAQPDITVIKSDDETDSTVAGEDSQDM